MLSYASLFFLIFDIAIPGINNSGVGSALLSLLLSGAVLLFSAATTRNIMKEVKNFRAIIFIYLGIFFYSCFRILVDGIEEPSFLLSSLKASFILCAVVMHVAAFGIIDVDKKLVNIFAVNALICLIAGSFQEVLSVINVFKYPGGQDGLIPYRNAFLSGSGYYGIGAPYAVAFVLAIHLITEKSHKDCFIYIKIALIAAAGILAARTAFLGIGFGLVYLLFRSPKKFVIVALLLMCAAALMLQSEQISTFSDWIFEIFLNKSNASTGTGSTDDLVTMYFSPPETTFLFGDARFSSGAGYYGGTDAGYMRNILFGGLPITVLIVLIPMTLVYASGFQVLSIVIGVLSLVLHVKGSFIYNNPAGMPLIILISYWLNLKNKNHATFTKS